MSTLWQDIRFGIRMLIKNPGFTTIAVLSLALGIGACPSIFSLVNAILLSSLPVPKPHELRILPWSGVDPNFGNFSGSIEDDGPRRYKADSVSHPVFSRLREQCAEQADIFGYAKLHNVTVRAQHEAFSSQGLIVSDNFFTGLGVRPLIGRLFQPGDTSAEEELGIVITYPWWERQFDFDPGVLGQSVILNNHGFTIIGVLPQGFNGVHPGGDTEFYVSMAAQPQLFSNFPRTSPGHWWIQLMARLKPGISDEQFQTAVNLAFAHETESIMKEPKVLVADGRAGPAGDRNFYRKPLLLMLGVVGVVILVACANLAGLSLARGAVRQHEYAIRSAIGAGQWRLLRQMLTESLLLSLFGGGLGILFSLWGRDVICRLMAGSGDALHYDISLDLKVLSFTLAVTVVAAVLSSLLPALRAAFADPLHGLKDRTLFGALRQRTGRILVIGQVALSLLLLTGAGLYVRTLINLVHINPGFRTDNLLLLQVSPAGAGYKGEEIDSYYERVLSSLTAIPGVRSAAITQIALLGGWMSGGGFFTFPNHPLEGDQKPQAHRLTVSESFFSTMGVPLQQGREFTAADSDQAPKVVIVNQTFVQKYFPKHNPIGQILRDRDNTDWQIVGVCADIKYTDIKGEVPPTVYFSYRQDRIHDGFFAVRTVLPPMAIMSTARRALAAIDPNVPITKSTTQEQVRDEKIAHERMFAFLCGSLALLAVLLSWIGLYGLMAYNVARRTSEIGIRMALGATRRHIAWPILRDALFMALIGIVIGGIGALAVTRFIRSQLYGVAPQDPVTFTAAVISFLFVAVLAAWIPARRAAKVDPMTALRYE